MLRALADHIPLVIAGTVLVAETVDVWPGAWITAVVSGFIFGAELARCERRWWKAR